MTGTPVIDLLLVEDNPEDLALALRALRKARCADHVQVARDGAEALDFVFAAGAFTDRSPAAPPKVILLDLKLPRVDGLEVLRRLKGDARTRLIPVVMLSSSQEERDVCASYRLGANSYVVKPMVCEHYNEAIRKLVAYWLQLNQAHH